MKRLFYLIVLCAMLSTHPFTTSAGEKQDAHVAYVLKTMKLKAPEQSKLKPLLEAYYKELSAIKAPHKTLKDKLEEKDLAGKLSTEECDQLFESKQKQETAELALKKKYYAQFKAVLSTQQAYKAVRLLGDKVK